MFTMLANKYIQVHEDHGKYYKSEGEICIERFDSEKKKNG